MPEKLETCVKALRAKGYEEGLAYAICNATTDSIPFVSDATDSKAIISKNIDEHTGFLTLNAVISRVGVHDYYGMELDDSLDPFKVYGVFRPPEEVFAKDSVNSFVNCPATDDHPSEMVTTDNAGRYIKGSISTVSEDGDHLTSVMTITDTSLIRKITDGKVELSVGYTNELVKQTGEHNGKSYDFIQTNIKANHVAVVDRGRCGASCKLTADNGDIISNETKKGVTSMKVMIGDQEFEVADAVAKRLADAEEELKKKEEEMEDMEEEAKKSEDSISTLTASNDKLQATIDTMKASQTKDADIDKLVVDRSAIMFDAQRVLGDKFNPRATVCDMKKAVIAKVTPSMSLDGKGEAYVDAAFDMAMEKHKEVKQSLDNLSGGLPAGTEDKRVSAYDTYKETLANAHKK